MESTVFSTLVLIAFGLLFVVTGGIVYLTVSDWRDRRRREKEKGNVPSVAPKKKKAKS